MFTKKTFQFLEELAANNEREWFNAHEDDYEQHVREPALKFIREFQKPLKNISPFFEAVDKKVGGSLMRIHRDTRFGKDKTPYKTNIGIQFRHEFGCDVHAPGFYVHVAADECFLGAGMWMPENKVLSQLRASIDEEPKKWIKTRDNRQFQEHFELTGDSLKTAPQGYPKDHPQIVDLRRKSFIGISPLSRKEVIGATFSDVVAERFKTGKPLMRWLCEALELPV
ncbi:DUF2461 domain-containing protein [Calycomorphotria hydatis]|uniref:TIGR02453 family protein n=1 Tax=Calycomorphotria hydatis TaxID=2528027 RepID=A0A517TAQ7_9PLAN|nr:DUF2461 domain-containing protein [Calycomorphotria hydatis]QDT65452.1 hypothetical protein V22_27050 [Calycomorphotria hydatis]